MLPILNFSGDISKNKAFFNKKKSDNEVPLHSIIVKMKQTIISVVHHNFVRLSAKETKAQSSLATWPRKPFRGCLLQSSVFQLWIHTLNNVTI